MLPRACVLVLAVAGSFVLTRASSESGGGNSGSSEEDWNSSNEKREAEVHLVHHAPCSETTGPAQVKVRFPNMQQGTIVQSGPHCYTVNGTTQVLHPINDFGSLQVYMRLRFTTIGGIDEPCSNMDADGFGGVGTCKYRGSCDTQQTKRFTVKRAGEHIENCQQGDLVQIEAGNYTDVSMEMCFPNKDELLGLLDPDKDEAERLWDLFLQQAEQTADIGFPVIFYAYLFEDDLSGLDKTALDAKVASKEGMIGCHWLYARVFSRSKSGGDV